MLNRILIHLSLIVLFAFTQIGGAVHAVNHYAEQHHQEQHQQDQGSHEEQCGQCITYSHIADADVTHDYWFSTTPLEQVFSSDAKASHISLTVRFYGARAPPTFLQA